MQAVAFETEAYALLDTMAYITSEVYTLVIGEAMGNAAMLVASGKKGNRFMLPHSRMMTCPPRMNRSFGSTVNMMIRAEDLEYNTQVYSRIFSGVVLLVTQDTKRGSQSFTILCWDNYNTVPYHACFDLLVNA